MSHIHNHGELSTWANVCILRSAIRLISETQSRTERYTGRSAIAKDHATRATCRHWPDHHPDFSAWFRRSENDCNEFAQRLPPVSGIYIYERYDRQVMSRHRWDATRSRMFCAHCDRRHSTAAQRWWCWMVDVSGGTPSGVAAAVGDHLINIARAQLEMIAFSLSPLMSHFATYRRDDGVCGGGGGRRLMMWLMVTSTGWSCNRKRVTRVNSPNVARVLCSDIRLMGKNTIGHNCWSDRCCWAAAACCSRLSEHTVRWRLLYCNTIVLHDRITHHWGPQVALYVSQHAVGQPDFG